MRNRGRPKKQVSKRESKATMILRTIACICLFAVAAVAEDLPSPDAARAAVKARLDACKTSLCPTTAHQVSRCAGTGKSKGDDHV